MKILFASLLLVFFTSLNAQDFVQIKNRWKKDGKTDYKINIEKESVDAGAVLPNWWSADWVLEKIPGENLYYIRNRWKKDGKSDYYLYVDFQTSKLKAGPITKTSRLEAWALEKVPDTKFYRIKNKFDFKNYLHIENATLEAGPIKPNWWSAMWEIEGAKGNLATEPDRSQRTIRLKIKQFVCEVSDDEGAGNNADMSAFNIEVRLFQQSCGGALVYKYNWNGPEKEVKAGDVHAINETKDIVFSPSCSYHDFSLRVDAEATEHDTTSADEKGSNSVNLSEKGDIDANVIGNHSFKITSNDFTYRLEFSIEKVDW